jgi:hypothetical protein
MTTKDTKSTKSKRRVRKLVWRAARLVMSGKAAPRILLLFQSPPNTFLLFSFVLFVSFVVLTPPPRLRPLAY